MSRVYTDLAVFPITPEGVVVRDLFGIDFDDLQGLVPVHLLAAGAVLMWPPSWLGVQPAPAACW